MPVLSASRQANHAEHVWFQRADSVAILLAVQQQLAPELERVCGSHGVSLHACQQACGQLPQHVSEVLSLYRHADGFHGNIHCDADSLPLQSSSQSLVLAAFVLETVTAPDLLLAEFARVLRPEGVLLLLTLNPWALFRSQSGYPRASARLPSQWAQRVRASGLEIEQQRALGPCLPGIGAVGSTGWLSGLRIARLIMARRRDSALTPLRWASPALGMGQRANANG